MQTPGKFLLLSIFSSALLAGPSSHSAETKSRSVILSTTTSTQDSGLLDVLVPLFEKQSGYGVKTISVGTGQALALAAKGDADVALVHAPGLEKKYGAEGKLRNRRLVMYNDFVIIGPKDDPAKIG
jgi:tungstate transport system substrate-binding protein